MTTARPPLVTRQQIGDIAIEVDAECGTLARTGDATTIGMMVIAMNRLQAIYEAELAVVITKAEYDALVAAAQDAEYEPVPNGTYNNIAIADNRLYLRISYKAATVYLPDTWRLMRPRKQAD